MRDPAYLWVLIIALIALIDHFLLGGVLIEAVGRVIINSSETLSKLFGG